MSKESKKIAIHARVTKEIMITEEQAEHLVNLLCNSSENNDSDDILKTFMDGINPGGYENGYIPTDWLYADLINGLPDGETKNYLRENADYPYKDIDL